MLAVDPLDLAPCREFLENPKGPHSPALQRLLNLLRWEDPPGLVVGVMLERGRRWCLGRLPSRRGEPATVFPDLIYSDRGALLCALFKLRWEKATGRPLGLGEPLDLATARHEPMVIDQPMAYSDPLSAAPGETIDFKVSGSGDGPLEVTFHRLLCGVDLPGAPGIRLQPADAAEAGTYDAPPQPLKAGSFGEIDERAAFALESFTLAALVFPTLFADGGEQMILGTWDAARAGGYGLGLSTAGGATLWLGEGSGAADAVSTGRPLQQGYWYLIAAAYDASEGTINLVQRPLAPQIVGWSAAASRGLSDKRPRGHAAFRLAAASGGAVASGAAAACLHFNGKIEAPRVWSLPLTLQELLELGPGDPPAHLREGQLADWDLSVDIAGTGITDTSGNDYNGATRNMPTRAVTGARWDGTRHDWRQDPSHYAAIHFHDDDLYDAGWRTTFQLTVPADWKSSCYVAEMTQGGTRSRLAFFVRPPPGQATAPLALLMSSATYLAYANNHLEIEHTADTEKVSNGFTVVDRRDLLLMTRPDLGLSTYDCHSDGSGVAFSSRLRPIAELAPGNQLWSFTADTLLIDWLESRGIAYDIITDEDLDRPDREGGGLALLAGYRAVMTGTHPEYYSPAMLQAMTAYQAGGGRLIYAGGNGFYWRVATRPDLPGLIEMRRAEDGMRSWITRPGEYHHALDGALGGLWTRAGQPPQATAGVGFIAQGFDVATHYRRLPASFDPRAAWIFEGVGPDEKIGDFGVGLGGAAGVEIDCADPAKGTPPHALTVARADTFGASYHHVIEDATHAHAAITGETNPAVRADMVFYETAKGGALFATGSIGWAEALCHNGHDNNVSRIFENVVRRFVDPTPFAFDPSGER